MIPQSPPPLAPSAERGADAFYACFGMRAVTEEGLDEALAAAADALVAIYLWGEDCYNCEQFKKAALLNHREIASLELHWLHADVYEDTAMRRRFSLHGVPTFYFFHRGKRLGRITSWPGLPQFLQAVQGLKERISGGAGA
ncbi:MAG TPA: thioredoxin family protein [Burkholderiaceae bacterium]|nr:thioredoxin family protein [Burkholderiaceae bacterium]